MIDLHAHTTASDGTFSPRDLVAHAREVGLSALAITDHDTDAGWDEGLATGRELGVEVVPGIELSVEDDFGGVFARFHLLGYECSRDSRLLSQEVPRLQAERDKRNHEVLEVLAGMGMSIEFAELRAAAGNQAGRPHIAQLLLEKGHVSSLQEAFDRYLDSSAPAYRPKAVMKARDAVRAIREAGGVAIWAHPPFDRKKKNAASGEWKERFSWQQYNSILQAWIAWGLDGLETHYPTYDLDEIEWTHSRACEHSLIASGGSDFHGWRKKNLLGDCGLSGPVPHLALEQIRELARSR
jgi:predicted metal-dependent phosphoesterase TrpH